MAIWANGYCDPAEKGCGFRSPPGEDLPKYVCADCGRPCCPQCGKGARDPEVPAEHRRCDRCFNRRMSEARARAG